MDLDMVGKVKRFYPHKGYGFIQTEDREVFVHYSQIKTSGYKTLRAGDNVEFDLYEAEEGKWEAKNVEKI